MGLTNFPNGVSSFGVPVLPGMGGGVVAFRKVYFVDNNKGADANPGTSLTQPFSTIQKALNTVQDEDTIIVMRGTSSYDEALTTGQNIRYAAMTAGRGRNVSLIGAVPTNWAYNSPQLYNVSGATATLHVRSPGWRISGFRIVGDSGSPIGLRAEMAQSGNTADTNWATGLQVDSCVFYGATADHIGLELTAVGDARVYNCRFEQFLTSGKEALTHGANGFTFVNVRIEGCSFEDSIDNIVLQGQKCSILNCVVGLNHNHTLAKGIDLRSGGGSNGVHGCYLDGIYQTFAGGGVYEGVSNDDWAGNWSTDLSSGSVDAATGITWKAPAST